MSDAKNVVTTREDLDDGVLVVLSGEVDLVRSPALRSELMTMLDASPARVVVDLSGVPLMDSSGVATLIEVLQIQRSSGGKLVLCGLQEKVQSVFEITRLTDVFTIVADRDSARSA